MLNQSAQALGERRAGRKPFSKASRKKPLTPAVVATTAQFLSTNNASVSIHVSPPASKMPSPFREFHPSPLSYHPEPTDASVLSRSKRRAAK